MAHRTTHGAELFRSYLETNRLNPARAARLLGLSRPAVIGWIDGTKRPAASARLLVEKWSGGAIPALSWLTADELLSLSRIRPLV